jgi:hypothetical protein
VIWLPNNLVDHQMLKEKHHRMKKKINFSRKINTFLFMQKH